MSEARAAPVDEVLDALVMSLRESFEGPLKLAHVRKGPQNALRLAEGVDTVVIAGLAGMRGEHLGIGGWARVEWEFYVTGLVRASSPDAYRTHLQLAQAIWDWQADNRTLYCAVLRSELFEMKCSTDRFVAEGDDEFHVVDATIVALAARAIGTG